MSSPDSPEVPRHVAIIMDGNGRWARERGLPRRDGHRAGAESVREAVEACKEIGIELPHALRLLVGKLESPGEAEIKALMEPPGSDSCGRRLPKMHKQGVRLHAIGRLDLLPDRAAAREFRIARSRKPPSNTGHQAHPGALLRLPGGDRGCRPGPCSGSRRRHHPTPSDIDRELFAS